MKRHVSHCVTFLNIYNQKDLVYFSRNYTRVSTELILKYCQLSLQTLRVVAFPGNYKRSPLAPIGGGGLCFSKGLQKNTKQTDERDWKLKTSHDAETGAEWWPRKKTRLKMKRRIFLSRNKKIIKSYHATVVRRFAECIPRSFAKGPIAPLITFHQANLYCNAWKTGFEDLNQLLWFQKQKIIVCFPESAHIAENSRTTNHNHHAFVSKTCTQIKSCTVLGKHNGCEDMQRNQKLKISALYSSHLPSCIS